MTFHKHLEFVQQSVKSGIETREEKSVSNICIPVIGEFIRRGIEIHPKQD